MSDEITPEIFEHMVRLAALELEPGQAEYLRRELNNQLKAIHELEAIPLDPDTAVTLHGVPYTNENSAQIRPDEWVPFEAPEEILKQAPDTEAGYIVAPDTKHTELE
jgi:aspartyl-tRNA(Asn)/glutamyl-tRNA(Gln) amidotransferase subunit C